MTERREIVKRRQGQRPKKKRCSEHRRLLYVALTRARDRLYVCGFESKKGVKEGSWYELAQAAAETLGVKVTPRRRRDRAPMARWRKKAAI